MTESLAATICLLTACTFCGGWCGDDTIGDATYYSYTAPEPEGLRDQPLSIGEWIQYGSGSLAVLPYEAIRTARDPRARLLAFLQSAYEAGARLAGWDAAGFESRWCPTPEQLEELHVTAASEFGRPPRAAGLADQAESDCFGRKMERKSVSKQAT